MIVLLAGGGTGGHLMPALALAAALRDAHAAVEPVLVGAERGVEAQILPGYPYRYHLLPSEPVYRRSWWRNARWTVVLPRLLRRCRRLLMRERPAFVVGTGGYAAGPVLYAAGRRRIPIALQEQNALPGLTTRLMASRASQIHLGFPEAENRLRPGRRTTVYALGNPIAPPIRTDRGAARRALGLPPDRPVVLVTGGSQGARAINAAVAGALDVGLLRGVTVLWSTGAGTYDDFARFADAGSVLVRPFWDPIAEAYAAADLVVARAGAMTTAELTAWGLPSVLVPLPTAAADHQAANARALAASGAAVHLPESTLTSERIGAAVRDLVGAPDRLAAMASSARRRGRPDAARAIAEHLLELAR